MTSLINRCRHLTSVEEGWRNSKGTSTVLLAEMGSFPPFLSSNGGNLSCSCVPGPGAHFLSLLKLEVHDKPACFIMKKRSYSIYRGCKLGVSEWKLKYFFNIFQPKPMEKRPFSWSQTSMFGLITRALVPDGYIPESIFLKLYGG